MYQLHGKWCIFLKGNYCVYSIVLVVFVEQYQFYIFIEKYFSLCLVLDASFVKKVRPVLDASFS